MLGRTAANLFWLSRYIERAENVARLLEVGYRLSLTAQLDESGNENLLSTLQAASAEKGYFEKYDETDFGNVMNYLLFDPQNESSIYSCLASARTNGRAVRTAITTDMWETLNSVWLEFSHVRPRDVTGKKLPEMFLWVKQASHQFRGALLGTFLRRPGFAFSQLGNFIERGDSTARILDMKYYVLLPRASQIGDEMDVQQWSFILRATSAHRSYRHVYHDRYKAWNIADYLILRPEMPRSLKFCMRYVVENTGMLAGMYGQELTAHAASTSLLNALEGNNMDHIFQDGLHEFLTSFIFRNNLISAAIAEDYNFY